MGHKYDHHNFHHPDHNYRGVWPRKTPTIIFKWTKNWSRTGLTYGVASALAVTYFFDWKYVLKHVPFLNTKWKNDD